MIKPHIVAAFSIAILASIFTHAQVLDPDDPIVEYDPDNPPATPADGAIAKWVITPFTDWSSEWKAYYFNGYAFRLRFPENYDPGRAEKYPLSDWNENGARTNPS